MQNHRKLRILHTVEMYDPQVGGSEEVVKQLSERLALRGHDVTVATSFHPSRQFSKLNGVEIRQFKIAGNRVTGIHGEVDAYQRFLLQNRFDIILNYGAKVWSSDLVFPLLSRLDAAKVLVPCGYNALWHPHFREYFEHLPHTLQQYDRVAHLSGDYRDARFSRHHGLQNSVVIGNAANEDEFLQPSESFRMKYGIQTPYLIITVANHWRGKGHNYVLKWYRQLQRDDATLAIIGNRAPKGCWEECLQTAASLPGVRLFEGLPRKDVVSAYKDADLFWFGSKVESFPLVILEAMAAGIPPWLSTDVGNVAELSGGWIGTPEQMARKANMLLNSKVLRSSLAQKGYQQWQNKYTWQRIVDEYEALYWDIAPSPAPADLHPAPDEPLVSIVIPCFNQAQYLADAVESVLEQTYRNFEILVIDDGQVGIAAFAQEMNRSDKISYIQHDRYQDRASAREIGIKKARGKYLAYLNDNLSDPDQLHTLVRHLENGGALPGSPAPSPGA